MATATRNDPFRVFRFRVEIDGISVMAFSEAGGLNVEGGPVEYREGTDKELHVRKLPGLRKYADITLKRGKTEGDKEMFTWYTNIANGVDDRRDGTITLMNEAGQDVMRWHFEKGWVDKIEGPSLNATGNEVAYESVTICHEKLTFELA
jgi:phage tail-like protein